MKLIFDFNKTAQGLDVSVRPYTGKLVFVNTGNDTFQLTIAQETLYDFVDLINVNGIKCYIEEDIV